MYVVLLVYQMLEKENLGRTIISFYVELSNRNAIFSKDSLVSRQHPTSGSSIYSSLVKRRRKNTKTAASAHALFVWAWSWAHDWIRLLNWDYVHTGCVCFNSEGHRVSDRATNNIHTYILPIFFSTEPLYLLVKFVVPRLTQYIFFLHFMVERGRIH